MVRAKFRVFSVLDTRENGLPEAKVVARSIKMDPVYSSDPKSPNYSWAKWTPSGVLSMMITNPDAFVEFEEGKEFYIDFTPVE